MRLAGKVALITGAGSGMGRVAALTFAREGVKVVATDVDTAAGQDTEASARADGLDVRFVRADVSREADCQAMVAQVARNPPPKKTAGFLIRRSDG